MFLIVNINQNLNNQKQIIDYAPNDPFEGAFSYLTSIKGKNALVISTSGDSRSNSRNCINKKWCGAWISSPEQNSWIKFDLKMIKILVKSYTLRLLSVSRAEPAPQSWCVEGSNDNYKWFVIDEHRKNSTLVGNSNPHNFTCIASSSYRYVRIRQTDVNSLGGHAFCLSNIEFFGVLSSIES
ncbi:hypothetical protein TRFO_29139 [Tritrichomonas foetus]|uniref:F5/8 type C domain-containing protein n=1 Tax=Tritrichomonas foetus TaxID=1144522 RepID=A0A1J4JYD7_9EUKA|nr:hypothetical protein TRFO_29139 [Tritrichomonas foetus]|eukprot:OHT03480.1 hypothetical protein TRFO_29139 [Tritrichomonas foetus]